MISTLFSLSSTGLGGKMVISVPAGLGVKEKKARLIGAKKKFELASVEQAVSMQPMQGCREAALFSTKPARLSLKGHGIAGVPLPHKQTDRLIARAPETRCNGSRRKKRCAFMRLS